VCIYIYIYIVSFTSQGEAVRLARQLPTNLSREDVEETLLRMDRQLAENNRTCIHGRPFLQHLSDVPSTDQEAKALLRPLELWEEEEEEEDASIKNISAVTADYSQRVATWVVFILPQKIKVFFKHQVFKLSPFLNIPFRHPDILSYLGPLDPGELASLSQGSCKDGQPITFTPTGTFIVFN